MHGLIESARKQWYRLTMARRLARSEWNGRYWYERDRCRIVPCLQCPKYDEDSKACSVPFGSPVRKCVVAALEAHLHGTRGMTTLELGYGRRSLAKRVIELSGGSWTGLEPGAERDGTIRIGAGGYGHAGHIPFDDETFDLVFGIQSFEHWEEQHPNIPVKSTYASSLREVWRVLKPGAVLYVDAPIHLHGHEMFIAGDISRILGLFDPDLWTDVVAEKWRYAHDPLPRYPTPEKETMHWPSSIAGCSGEDIERIKTGGSVWLLAITARKRARAEAAPDAHADVSQSSSGSA